MSTALEVIETARDRHRAFNARQHPNGTLLRLLSQYHRTLVGRTLMANGAHFLTEQIIPMPFDPWADGVELISPLAILRPSLTYRTGGRPGELRLIPPSTSIDPKPVWAGWVEGGRLFLAGEPSAWQAVDQITITYTQIPAPLTTLGQSLLLSPMADEAMSLHLAHLMANRGNQETDVEGPDEDRFLDDWQNAERQYLESLLLETRSEITFWREDY